jgi:periplasmic copper chaperone A
LSRHVAAADRRAFPKRGDGRRRRLHSPTTVKEKIMTRYRSVGLAILMFVAASSGLAQQSTASDITIDRPWSRATPKGSSVAVGYLIIHNHGFAPDRLMGGSAEFASEVSVHEMTMDNGIMRMRELASGLEVPARGEVALSPKGLHLMFTGLRRPLKKGDDAKATLKFEHAGEVVVEFRVGGVGDAAPDASPVPQDSMKGMKM